MEKARKGSDQAEESDSDTSEVGKKRASFWRGNSEGCKVAHKPTNAGLKLDDPQGEFTSAATEMIEFLLEALRDEREERQTGLNHKEQKAQAAQKHAEAAERQAVAADKQATALLIKSKTELLDRVIKCREMGIELPAELMAMLRE